MGWWLEAREASGLDVSYVLAICFGDILGRVQTGPAESRERVFDFFSAADRRVPVSVPFSS